jgi:hypothetical protein
MSGLFFGAFMKLISFILFSLFSFSSFAQFAPVANVIRINGEVQINKEKIEKGAEIATGMEISMPKRGSFIDIKFQNGHFLRLKDAVASVQLITPKEYFFNLKKGEAYSLVKSLTEGEKYSIKVKDVLFNVRGTKFVLDAKSNDTALIVTDGVVTAEKEKSIVEVRKGQTLNLGQKGKVKAFDASSKLITESNQVFEEMQNN